MSRLGGIQATDEDEWDEKPLCVVRRDNIAGGINVEVNHPVASSPAFVAALRRIMMDDVCTWSIQSVVIDAYDGFDVIDHVGMKILNTVLDQSKAETFFGGGGGGGGGGGAAAGSKTRPTHTIHFTCRSKEGVITSGDVCGAVASISNHIICTSLRSVNLSGSIVFAYDSGRRHKRWSPAVGVSVRKKGSLHWSADKVNALDASAKRLLSSHIAASCPSSAIIPDVEDLVKLDANLCTRCNKCYEDWNDSIGFQVEDQVEATFDGDTYTPALVHVETNGSISPESLLLKSIDFMRSSASQMLGKIKM